MARRRRNPFSASETSWGQAEMAARDALEEGGPGAAQRVIDIIGQVSAADLGGMLCDVVQRVLDTDHVKWAKRAGVLDKVSPVTANVTVEWNVIRLTIGHVKPPSGYLAAAVIDTRLVIENDDLMQFMFRDAGARASAPIPAWYEIVFDPEDWLAQQRGMDLEHDQLREEMHGRGVRIGRQRIPVIKNPPAQARRVVGVLKRAHGPHIAKVVSEPREAALALKAYLGERATEQFAVLYLDANNKIVGFADYTEGGITGVSVVVGDIIRNALISGAPGFLTAHNHPSGKPTPSSDDRNIWHKVKTLATEMGMVCLDNLVLGETSYYSESEDREREYPL